uniref:Uncharacterized protein n=1 Tax=Glossina palpalis gambiensis TaxID=67801 RepID=A0A1B0BCL9_9MUSC
MAPGFYHNISAPANTNEIMQIATSIDGAAVDMRPVIDVVPKSTAETPSSAPSSFCSPTTGATATASTIAGRSGALKPPDNCQPTFNTLPTPPTAITPGTSSSIRARAHTRTTTINSTNTRLSMKIHPFNQRLFTSKRGYLCKGRHESQDTSGFQQYPSVKYLSPRFNKLHASAAPPPS